MKKMFVLVLKVSVPYENTETFNEKVSTSVEALKKFVGEKHPHLVWEKEDASASIDPDSYEDSWYEIHEIELI